LGDEWRSHLGKDFICSAVTAIACPDPVAAAVLNAIDQGDRQLLQIVLVRYRSEQHPTDKSFCLLDRMDRIEIFQKLLYNADNGN